YPHRRPGRPAIDQDVRQPILRLARENSHWGYVRIVGELRKLGVTVSATLVRNVLARAGIPPAPKARRLQLALIPAPTRRHDHRLRLLYGRHSVAAAAVPAVLRLDRDAPGRVRRLHTPSGFGVDDPAGPQPADGSRRPRQPTAVLDPRSRSEVQPRLRRH